MTGYESVYSSPLGKIRLIASDEGLRNVLLPDEKPGRVPLPEKLLRKKNAILKLAERQLDEYFAGKRTKFTVPLEMVGTDFEKQVWRGLLTIPYGETRFYAALAKQVGRPLAARAVGRANSLNPLSIVVPCHRVIGKNGKLVGFAGGLGAKEFLLNLEMGQRR